jgi:hypothetical protein
VLHRIIKKFLLFTKEEESVINVGTLLKISPQSSGCEAVFAEKLNVVVLYYYNTTAIMFVHKTETET